jgi:hypothetical protein
MKRGKSIEMIKKSLSTVINYPHIAIFPIKERRYEKTLPYPPRKIELERTKLN